MGDGLSTGSPSACPPGNGGGRHPRLPTPCTRGFAGRVPGRCAGSPKRRRRCGLQSREGPDSARRLHPGRPAPASNSAVSPSPRPPHFAAGHPGLPADLIWTPRLPSRGGAQAPAFPAPTCLPCPVRAVQARGSPGAAGSTTSRPRSPPETAPPPLRTSRARLRACPSVLPARNGFLAVACGSSDPGLASAPVCPSGDSASVPSEVPVTRPSPSCVPLRPRPHQCFRPPAPCSSAAIGCPSVQPGPGPPSLPAAGESEAASPPSPG